MPHLESLSVYEMSLEQIEARIREIERNYEEFFAAARDGFYISTREGRFLDCNQALVQMLGYRVPEEVLMLFLDTDLWTHTEDRSRFRAIIEEQGHVKDYEAVWKRKDGSPLHCTLTAHVWRDSKGKIRGYRGFVVDRTREKIIFDQLEGARIKYRHLFENIHEGFCIADTTGTVLECNQALCDLIGRTREEFMGMNYYRDLFVNADDVMDFRRRFTREGFVRDYELQIVRKDGTIRDVSMGGYAGRNSAGEITSYQAFMRDITDAKRLRTRLIQSERLSAMGKMASQLAHELNNPIYGIMNCLDLLKSVVPEHHDKRKYLELAYNECKRTSGLLIKMLKFFKPDEEQKTPSDINKLLEETLLFYERQFKNLNIRVATNLQANLPNIMAVQSQLKQVFINMIINANTAMPSGGELYVASSYLREENQIAVVIRDTGVGISPENMERIFDAFFTTKKEVKGVGLGLSICHGFIQDHGGRIDVQSEVGKGTTFTIYLPLSQQAAVAAAGS